MADNFYITTPIYYVNDEPHIGHAYTTIAADVIARFNRLLGRDTFFLTGTDEHGQKLQDTAASRGMEPGAYCDEIVKRFIDIWDKLNISNNDFIRTTQERHKKVVQHILQKLYDEEEIYKGSYEGWYCKYEERFWTEKDLVEGNCPDCGRPVNRIVEENYFFKMGQRREWLIDYIKAHPDFIRPEFRANEVIGYLNQGLADLCISRPKTRLSWGIELPFDKDYVCYVWFDALLNYVTAPGYLDNPGNFQKWWPEAIHLIGKDILTTHAVYWPCMLNAAGLPMPKTIFAHGWWLMEDTKMSKSLGNVVRPLDLADVYGVDPFRYFLMREMTMGHDSSYSEEAFINRYNSDLANDFGNLVSRLTKMIASYCGKKLPAPDEKQEADLEIERNAVNLNEKVVGLIDDFKIYMAIEETLQLVRLLNRYIENNRPWQLAKQGDIKRLGTVLYTACEGLRIAGRFLYPVMPAKIAEFSQTFGIGVDTLKSEESLKWGFLKPGIDINVSSGLFPRIEQKKKPAVEPEKKKTKEEKEEFIDFEDFKKLKLKTALIEEAEKIEGADKLLKLQVNLGSEKRQVVAGIAQHYTPEQLVGKTIIVIANLKPAKIRGVESNGMLMAAKDKNGLRLLTVDGEIKPGSGIS
ncbi:MAG: methionine--tRNA ligase [candidate division Zixibacteria bacterium]|nr:methionine--tRNA ligase [candidate division Zixibacteria bacterium]